MSQLPALVVHGWWISKLLVATTAAGAFGALALLRRRLVGRTAQHPVARPALLGPWLPLGAAICALAGYLGLRAFGGACIPDRASEPPYGDRLGAFAPLAIAAALPGTRDDALEELELRV